MKKSFWIIISIVATAATVAFTSSDTENLDVDSAGSLAATAETFPSSNQNVLATALFPLSNAEAGAIATVFLLLLLLPRFKRCFAQHRSRKRNHQIPPKLRLECSVFSGMNIAECIQQTRRTLAQSFPRLKEPTGICIVSMAMLTMPVDVNAQVQPTPEIILYGTDTVRKHIYEHVAWGIPLVVGKRYWRSVSIESHKTYKPSSRGRLQEKAFYREIYPEYWVRDYGEYALVIETDHYVDDGQEEGHKNIRWKVLGKATEDTMGENKIVRNFLPTVNNAHAIDWAGKDSIVGTEITYEHPWWNLWTLAPGSKKTETSSGTSVMLVAKHRSGRRRFKVYVDYGIDGSASDIITHNYSVFLNPGEVWTMSISCPRGSYATVSVSARHNGRPRGKSQGTGYGASNSSVYFYWQIRIQGPDFGVGGSSPIQSQSTNSVSSSNTSSN